MGSKFRQAKDPPTFANSLAIIISQETTKLKGLERPLVGQPQNK